MVQSPFKLNTFRQLNSYCTKLPPILRELMQLILLSIEEAYINLKAEQATTTAINQYNQQHPPPPNPKPIYTETKVKGLSIPAMRLRAPFVIETDDTSNQ